MNFFVGDINTWSRSKDSFKASCHPSDKGCANVSVLFAIRIPLCHSYFIIRVVAMTYPTNHKCKSCLLMRVTSASDPCSYCVPKSQRSMNYQENRVEMKMARYMAEHLPGNVYPVGNLQTYKGCGITKRPGISIFGRSLVDHS